MTDTAPAAEEDFADMDVTRLPTEAVVTLARKQALLAADPRVLAPEGVDVDVQETLEGADVEDVRWEDGHLFVDLKTTTLIEERVRRASRHEPAEYRTHDAETLISIMWTMNPEERPEVDIEVLEP